MSLKTMMKCICKYNYNPKPLEIEEKIDPGGQSGKSSGLPVPGALHIQQEGHHEQQGADGSGPVHVVRKISQVVQPLPEARNSVKMIT